MAIHVSKALRLLSVVVLSAVLAATGGCSLELREPTSKQVESDQPEEPEEASVLTPAGDESASGGEPEPDREGDESDQTMRPELKQALDNGNKLVAFTFDDGPYAPSTGNMLELLRKENVKATFFLVGFNASVFPELALAAADDSHQIASHTYNHNNLTTLSAEEFVAEVQGNNDWLEEVCGVRPTMLRPPGGNLNDEVKQNMNMPIILWSVDPRDWATTDDEAIFRHVVDHTEDGDIVLMHDVYKATVKAAERIIPALKDMGFFFVTVEELISLRGELENGQVYTRLPPPIVDNTNQNVILPAG